MKKKKITYGVPQMMEYHIVVPVGKSKVNVVFTDGTTNAMSASPAKFTTDNLMLQIAIQNCRDFKRGRIIIISEIELDEEVPILRNASKTEGNEQLYPELQNNDPDEPETTEDKLQEEQIERPDFSKGTTQGGEEAAGLKEVKVNVNDDAKDYLETNFGVIRSKLRTRADIDKIAAENGIKFVFAK